MTAADDGKVYGDPEPASFAYTLSGFKNGEDATAAGVTGDPTIARHPGEDVGPYAIDVTGRAT